MALAEQQGGSSYQQLAEEIGTVLQAAADAAEKMLDEARADAARIRAAAEGDRRTAFAEGRRILDEARTEADMARAEAEWQSQEIVAAARRQAAERLAGADNRLAELNLVESQVMSRLAGVGQMLTEMLASWRAGASESPASPAEVAEPVPTPALATEPIGPALGGEAEIDVDDEAEAEADEPTAKVYFVEFPPAAAETAPDAPEAADPEPEAEIVLPDAEMADAGMAKAEMAKAETGRPEWQPPADMPTWWTRGAEG